MPLGRDFFDPAWPMYAKAQREGYLWDTNQDYIRGDFTPENKPSHSGADGSYQFIIKASYGGNIYCVPFKPKKTIR